MNFSLRNIFSRKASKTDDAPHICVRNDIVKSRVYGRQRNAFTLPRNMKIYPPYQREGDTEDPKPRCFQKTVYSDSIIVDAVPLDAGNTSHYVKNNGYKGDQSGERPLSRDQVIHMLKNRYKDDLKDWKERDQQPADKSRSEPLRSSHQSLQKLNGSQCSDVYPSLPRKSEGKSGTVWLQFGEEIKQVRFLKDDVTMQTIMQMFQINFQKELEKCAFSVDQSILLIKDPFSKSFKELEDARYVLPGSHLKLLRARKRPCCTSHYSPIGKSVSFDERTRSNSVSSLPCDAYTPLSRTRVANHSFHGRTTSGYHGTFPRNIRTSTLKANHSRPAAGNHGMVCSGDISTVRQNHDLRHILPVHEEKRKSPSDLGIKTRTLKSSYSNVDGQQQSKPPAPMRSSSREVMKLHSSKETDIIEDKFESSRIPTSSGVWVSDTRVMDNNIKVTSAYLKKNTKKLRVELNELRSQQEHNVHTFNTLLSKTRQQIMAALEDNLPDGSRQHVSLQRRQLEANELAYRRNSDNAEKLMGRIENKIEMLLHGGSIINKSRMKSDELDDIQDSIDNVSQTIASMKLELGTLSSDARVIMAEELHLLIEEERFFKGEPDHLNQLVKRCRHAAGTHFTLQKLAFAQEEMDGYVERERKNPVDKLLVRNQLKFEETEGAQLSLDFNKNTISQGSGIRPCKVRFNDATDITYLTF